MNNLKILMLLSLIMMALLCCTGCKSNENKWIPLVQGSNVMEMPYENIDGGFKAEKYTSFNSLKKSSLADYNFIAQKTAKEERYSEEFFKTRDLAVIKFNSHEKGIDYTVIDVSVIGNKCTVKLLPMKRVAIVETQDTTYSCFLETEKDIENWDIRLEIEDAIVHESTEFSYISKEDNLPYLFQDENAPVVFKITSKSGIEDFIENDSILDRQNYVSASLLSYSDKVFTEASLLLVRVASSDLENCAACISDNAVEIVGVKSNHYMFDWDKEHKYSALIALLVPRDFTPEGVIRSCYTEYEDNTENQVVHNEYRMSGTTSVTDDLMRFDFTK